MEESSFIKLPVLHFPEKYQIRLKLENEVVYIFCKIRKKWFKWTPEEWVRQHTVHYLIQSKNIPVTAIGVEVPSKVHNLNQRIDIAVYKDSKIDFLIECKAPKIAINQVVLDQSLRYCQVIRPSKLLLTNGIEFVFSNLEYEPFRISFEKNLL